MFSSFSSYEWQWHIHTAYLFPCIYICIICEMCALNVLNADQRFFTDFIDFSNYILHMADKFWVFSRCVFYPGIIVIISLMRNRFGNSQKSQHYREEKLENHVMLSKAITYQYIEWQLLCVQKTISFYICLSPSWIHNQMYNTHLQTYSPDFILSLLRIYTLHNAHNNRDVCLYDPKLVHKRNLFSRI